MSRPSTASPERRPWQWPHLHGSTAAGAHARSPAIPAGAMLVLWAYLLITLMTGFTLPFPSGFDELQHLSAVRSQLEHPALLPDYAAMFVLRPDLSGWSAVHNYINHPSPYYLALAAAAKLGGGVTALRLINVALSVLALAIVVAAGCRVLRDDAERTLFAILAAAFPKAAVIGGLINNDNLAALAGALVFAGLLSGSAAGPWLLAAGLAIAGWSKLTALIGLGAAAVVWHAWKRERGPCPPLAVWAGIALGALPYLANLLARGHLLYVSRATYYVPPAHRPELGPPGYAAYFLTSLTDKWPAAEASAPRWLGVPMILLPIASAALGTRAAGIARRVAPAYLAALALMLAIHLAFGWRAFESMGDLTIAQTRYYNVLWPGLALAGAAGIAMLWRRSRLAAAAAFGLYLWPTVLGGVAFALIHRVTP